MTAGPRTGAGQASAQEFFEFHAQEMNYSDWEAELLQGVEG